MLKSKSCSSGLTRATLSEEKLAPIPKFNLNNIACNNSFTTTLTHQYPLKFPKRLMHKQTSMNMLIQSEEVNRKLCLKANPAAHKATMLEKCLSKRQLKSGDFSHLAFQSPSKQIRQRQFEDIGAVSNRKKRNQDQFNSTCMLASINESAQNVESSKYVKNIEKKHYKNVVQAQVKKQLEWPQEKTNKDRFQMKYRKCVEQPKKQKAFSSSYSSIHLKYTVHK